MGHDVPIWPKIASQLGGAAGRMSPSSQPARRTLFVPTRLRVIQANPLLSTCETLNPLSSLFALWRLRSTHTHTQGVGCIALFDPSVLIPCHGLCSPWNRRSHGNDFHDYHRHSVPRASGYRPQRIRTIPLDSGNLTNGGAP